MAQYRERFIVTRRVASCAKNVRLVKDRPRRVNRNTSTTAKQPLHWRLAQKVGGMIGAARLSCFLPSRVPLPKPTIGLRWRHVASCGEAQLKECLDASAAPIEYVET
jgi:hypothetical protein